MSALGSIGKAVGVAVTAASPLTVAAASDGVVTGGEWLGIAWGVTVAVGALFARSPRSAAPAPALIPIQEGRPVAAPAPND